MKTRLFQRLGQPARRLSPPVLALPLLLATLSTRADTTFTTTNWVAGVPVPGILCTNASGQVSLKGNVHQHRVVSADPRVAGRLTAWMDLAYQTDGTALFCGPAHVEPGAWDAAGTKFTPTGGVWTLNYTGVAQADGRDVVHMAGYGLGGLIEGLRLECTATKGPGTPFDPAIPYVASGTIKPAPVNTRVVVDNFDNNHFDLPTWTANSPGAGKLSLFETNQQLTLVGTWQTPTDNIIDHTAWIWTDRSWNAAAGQTVELRLDLARLTPAGNAAAVLGLYNNPAGCGYGLSKGSDWLLLWKEIGANTVICAGARVTTRDTNVVLALAVTSVGTNVLLTGRVLDRGGTAQGQLSWVDTPAKDTSLSASALTNIVGGRLYHDVDQDVAGAPWKDGTSVLLAVFKDTDGTAPPAEVTYDNVELRTYDLPQLRIERAVRLSWPSTGVNCTLETAPTANGPWLPVQNSTLPGYQQLTVPQNGLMEIFHIR